MYMQQFREAILSLNYGGGIYSRLCAVVPDYNTCSHVPDIAVINYIECNSATVYNQQWLVAGPRLLNNLPQHVTSASSLQIFKTRLKTHLFKTTFS